MPFEVFEEVNQWFEGVVSIGPRFGELIQEGFEGELVSGVEEEVCSECGDGVQCRRGDRVNRQEFGGEKEGEVAFSS